MHFRILSVCFICLFSTACEKQKQPEVINKPVINKPSEVKTAPEKVVQKKAVPALNLSIDNTSIELQNNENGIFNRDKEPTQAHSKIFKTLNKEQSESDTSWSGKIFTDQEKIDNKEYRNSIDGVQINIEGNF